jgi:sulfide dehydrogenase [flavocytochrome c] flavoprotein subunit
MTRRHFIRLLGATGLASGLGPLGLWAAEKKGQATGRVVVIGGGFGGATCAKTLSTASPGTQVILIEKDTSYVTCPFSNLVLGGLRDMKSITQGYDRLKRHGVKVIHDTVTQIDPATKKLTLQKGSPMSYDRLVVSPGIAFQWGAIEGYDEAAAELIPHAYRAGPQTVLLRKQLEAMKDGGTVIISVPPTPFRCPPGPFERASLIAHYLKTAKPKSKILILDANDKFSKQGLFMAGWKQLYPDMIEWVPVSKDGKVVRVDPKTKTVHTEFDKHSGDVVNIIPPQKAGQIAEASGLTNETGWCPVDPKTFESKVHPGIHVIGDSCIAGKMPKSGHSANSQAKVAAYAIAALLRDEAVGTPAYTNTCYSLIGPEYGISVAGIYRLTEEGISDVSGSGGVSSAEVPASTRQLEAEYTKGWYANITADIWGT